MRYLSYADQMFLMINLAFSTEAVDEVAIFLVRPCAIRSRHCVRDYRPWKSAIHIVFPFLVMTMERFSIFQLEKCHLSIVSQEGNKCSTFMIREASMAKQAIVRADNFKWLQPLTFVIMLFFKNKNALQNSPYDWIVALFSMAILLFFPRLYRLLTNAIYYAIVNRK